MQITDIKIRKLFDEGPMKAVVSVTFEIQFQLDCNCKDYENK